MANKFKLLESLDSGSNYNFGEKMNQPKNPKSLFDLSHLITTSINNAGILVPLTVFPTLPGDDHDISVDSLLRVLPQVVPLYSRQRLYIYAFYSRYSDLWDNFQVFMDKGYTGNVIKHIPSMSGEYNVYHSSSADPDIHQTVFSEGLDNYLGLPIGARYHDLFGDSNEHDDIARISCLPWMMYLRIYRDYFMNKNEWINDRVLLPDDDSRFRVNDNGELLSAKDQGKIFFFHNSYDTCDYDITINGNNYSLGLLYHEWPDDYFTSALPFTQRGSAPKLDYTVDLSQLGLDFTQSTFSSNPSLEALSPVAVNTPGVESTIPFLAGDDTIPSAYNQLNANLKRELNKGKITGSNIGLSIYLEDIRKLAIAQTEMEILARTDGSYRQFGLSFFGESSKAAHDYRPTYIGGVFKNLAFTEVLQTSESTSGKPLGGYAGHGITGMNNSRIGHIHCDDYGLIMILGCIMPDVYYSQGLEHYLIDYLQAEMYLPQRSKLGMQPIYNRELFYSGDNSGSQGGDEYLFAYQNPFDYLRYIPSKIRGKIADPNKAPFFQYTQGRYFTQRPNWGRDFSEAKNIRKDYLVGNTAESAYTAQFKFNIRSVRELPYKSVPASLVR